ncbi:hypothetical protein PAXINDRAFT_6876 [Paxillus involutus ATCC 200175]|nr:hypothetical protein PAXINDRAFT_6876 [Paxillus involutus ATCC 200175]
MKEEDPDHFPSDRMYTYSQNTSNTNLHGHIEKYHLHVYLTEADHNNWSIQIEAAKAAFSVGYTFTTLQEALQKPGASIRALPPAPQPGPGDSPPELAGSQPFSLGAGLPSFSPPVFHQFLVRFIVANNQSPPVPLTFQPPSLLYNTSSVEPALTRVPLAMEPVHPYMIPGLRPSGSIPVHPNTLSLNVIECPEFWQLLLLLRQDLHDSQIPHRTKLRKQ